MNMKRTAAITTAIVLLLLVIPIARGQDGQIGRSVTLLSGEWIQINSEDGCKLLEYEKSDSTIKYYCATAPDSWNVGPDNATQVPTNIPTATSTSTATVQPTETATQTSTATLMPTATSLPTNTPLPTWTPVIVATNTPLPTETATPQAQAQCQSFFETFWDVSDGRFIGPAEIEPNYFHVDQFGEPYFAAPADDPKYLSERGPGGIEFCVQVLATGDFDILIEIDAEDMHSDSFFYSIDDEAPKRLDIGFGSTRRMVTVAQFRKLDIGEHTISFYQREPDARLYRVHVLPNLGTGQPVPTSTAVNTVTPAPANTQPAATATTRPTTTPIPFPTLRPTDYPVSPTPDMGFPAYPAPTQPAGYP